jgi:hypothetical protein
MPKERPVDKVTKCIKDCKDDRACVTSCEQAFVAGGGRIETPDEGGKVFTDGEGGKVFITFGGKVF